MEFVATPRIVDVEGRQVHYRHAGRGPAVVLLHASPRSSAALLPMMAAAPPGVSMFAFDTPGFGHSAPLPQRRPGIEDFADALDAALQALGVQRAAVYATHTGAAIALALAVRAPQRVSGLVIDGVSAFDAAERAQLLSSYLPPFEPQVDGSHLARLWSRTRDQFLFFPWNHRGTGARLWRPLPDAAALQAAALDLLVARDYPAAYAAALRTDAAAWVAQLRVPALIGARPHDMLLPHLARLGPLPAGVVVERYAGDPAACDRRLWAALQAALPSEDAPVPVDPGLPAAAVGDGYAGVPGQRLHLRGVDAGALAHAGRPRILLHDSPGGPRLLDDTIAALAAMPGSGPVVAPSLPGHGLSGIDAGSDTEAVADRLEHALVQAGLGEADVSGFGLSAALARQLAARRPGRWRHAAGAPGDAPAEGTRLPPPPGAFAPRDDGASLFTAWQHARDCAILGPWWQRTAGGRHDFGDALDVAAIHRHAVEILHEAPSAAPWRAALCGMPGCPPHGQAA